MATRPRTCCTGGTLGRKIRSSFRISSLLRACLQLRTTGLCALCHSLLLHQLAAHEADPEICDLSFLEAPRVSSATESFSMATAMLFLTDFLSLTKVLPDRRRANAYWNLLGVSRWC